ncbi:bifunctional RNase H/acid phosphatase [Saccharothrix longispora]|uniref:bifunctional RNase H/acid phosphatase n=1 Tax=Saccharothrix longispora TaxID=33920 RepID=UPI0028FD4DEA|nr:bifunctional RNase H/acid phosphatase [Saccharothrix longispora]MBY8847981.1 bifunctional RNase H/acid phosphatase [Saccharothrix sp. MB29]MDU0291272.1 bifunctional RNase H/acid phosphatase [Saccharothrix longispora]
MKVVVEADGGSRGNPGPAGYGAVVRSAAGEVLAERSAGIGVATNNVAEYRGLLAGLRAAAEVGAAEVDVRMDSKLVVEQMSGRWKVKHPSMQPLVAEAREVVRAFDRVTYTWIPRERNKHADRLANEAMDEQAGVRRPDTAPAPVEDPVTEQAPPSSWTGAVGEPTRLYLLRHGQTALSVDRRYSGRGNPPLTEVGRGQAEAAARRLAKVGGVDVVVSSPLGRAAETARAVASGTGVEPTTHDGLIETDFGAWEGLTFTEAAERDPGLHRRWLADPSVPAPGGESFDQVHRRVRRALTDVIAAHGGANVVLVSHVTPIKSLLRMGLDVGPSLLFRLHLDLASLSVVEFYPDGHASVRLVNDTSHLR